MEYKSVSHSVAGREITLRIPADPEQVLSAAVDAGQEDQGASDPYWCLVWAAAPHTAELIVAHEWPSPTTALEIGCGVGLPGIAAELHGLNVTYSDYSEPAVAQALANARRNGIDDPQGLVLDWKAPSDQSFDLIFGSDVLYDRNNHQPVLDTLSRMLADDGQAWLGDMGRYALEGFVKLATDSGWQLTIVDEKGDQLPGPRHQSFQLLKLTR
ncbi:MAG: methyltransferase [Planctomycetaceae bacterium]|nr:methyltransferase [Planctomycetaceae bacterium]